MSNENYSPDEIRLLDEFAGRWMAAMVADSGHDLEPREWASDAYGIAAAMIAERRKRVPAIEQAKYGWPKTLGDYAKDCNAFKPWTAPEPDEYKPSVDAPSVAVTPQPEQQPSGELTEDAVRRWVKEARSVDDGYECYIVDTHDIDRAVALMREGLAAKADRDTYKRLLDEGAQPVGHTAMKMANDLLTEGLALAVKERDEARAALAAAQPVLDAVVRSYPRGYSWVHPDQNILKDYADRRRNEERAQQQGGA